MPSSPSLETLAARLETLERKHRRLRGFAALFFLLFLLAAGWSGYRWLMDGWQPGLSTRHITFFDQQPFSFGDRVHMAAGGALFLKEGDVKFFGGIGARQKGSGVFFGNEQGNRAALDVSERGAFLVLRDSTRAVYLGPGLYDDRQLLLELISHDGRQGLRLGLNARQQPVFQVIRDGKTTSLLDAAPVRNTSAGS